MTDDYSSAFTTGFKAGSGGAEDLPARLFRQMFPMVDDAFEYFRVKGRDPANRKHYPCGHVKFIISTGHKEMQRYIIMRDVADIDFYVSVLETITLRLIKSDSKFPLELLLEFQKRLKDNKAIPAEDLKDESLSEALRDATPEVPNAFCEILQLFQLSSDACMIIAYDRMRELGTVLLSYRGVSCEQVQNASLSVMDYCVYRLANATDVTDGKLFCPAKSLLFAFHPRGVELRFFFRASLKLPASDCTAAYASSAAVQFLDPSIRAGAVVDELFLSFHPPNVQDYGIGEHADVVAHLMALCGKPKNPRACGFCYKPGVNSKCAVCKVVRYCTSACQQKHNPIHKFDCKILSAAAMN
jgi:hypothetical protein